MKKINKTLLNKLKETSGESIAEVLLAILVCALSIIALVSMITASQGILAKSTEAYTKKIAEHNYMEEMLSWFGCSDKENNKVTAPDTVTTSGKGTITIATVDSEEVTNAVDIGGKITQDVTLYEGKYYMVFGEDSNT